MIKFGLIVVCLPLLFDAVRIKNSRSILSSLTFSPPEPRKLYRKDEISKSYYSGVKGSESGKLSLFDISNAFNRVVREDGLKLVNQQHSSQRSEYSFGVNKSDRQLSLSVDKNAGSFDVKLKNEDGKTIDSLAIDEKKYRQSDVYRFLKNNIQKQVDRKLFSAEEILNITTFTSLIEEKLNSLVGNDFGISFSDDREMTSVATINDVIAFEVSIEQGEEGHILAIANNIDTEDYHHFKADHFEFKRSLNESDNEESINAYLDYIGPQLLEKLDYLINPESHIESIYEALETHFTDFHFVKQNIEGSNQDAFLSVLVFKTSSDNNRLAEFQIIQTEANKYQIIIEKAGQDYTINLVPGQFDDALYAIQEEISSALNE